MFKNLNVRTRLAISFGAIVIIMVVICGSFFIGLKIINSALKLNVHSYKVIDDMRLMSESVIDMETGVRGFAISGDDKMLQPFSDGVGGFNKYMSELKILTSDNKNQTIRLAEIYRLESKWHDNLALPLIENRKKVVNGEVSVNDFISEFGKHDGKEQMDGIRAVIRDAVNEELGLMSEREVVLSREQHRASFIIVAGVLSVLFFSLIVWFLLSRGILKPLGLAMSVSNSISSGDLTSSVEITRNDEFGVLLLSLKNMQSNLRSFICEIKESAVSVEVASSEIEQGSVELSARTEEQAAALQQTAASMEQLNMTVRNNTESAEHAASSARVTESHSRDGGEVAIIEMSETMKSISSSAKKIREITGVIEGISFQTNILALNAAVEAARAGEHGKGFAVVASEVRNLAQRSASASREIGDLISEAVNSIDNGVSVASKTADSILRTASEVASLAATMDGIAMASVEQMQGIMQISSAVTQMDGVTQGNAALVEQSAAASQALNEQSKSLRQLTENFVI
ncbi:methyl-accepting chemotaxis protein [Pantoea vagans]|uniref:methyl-accepting chemotaxis protein n=1 Tax=Pantoea vagans TaxID=470934 RepID=UPI0023AF8B15|nr:methyl-accepting chemotaxis protein [Pantoea vagans]MDE8559416.1 methyl-accepting chemotaxis protein [Pantoea vagans]MDE8579407.1 methyl-accepting chemotaxis protein [Pantoea vagans]